MKKFKVRFTFVLAASTAILCIANTHTHTCVYAHETFAIKTNAKQYLFASCCRYELDVVH